MALQLPEVPEEEVADLAVGQRPVQQEFRQLAVQVGLVLEHLHQLQQVLEQLVIPAGKRGRWAWSSRARATGVCRPQGGSGPTLQAGAEPMGLTSAFAGT